MQINPNTIFELWVTIIKYGGFNSIDIMTDNDRLKIIQLFNTIKNDILSKKVSLLNQLNNDIFSRLQKGDFTNLPSTEFTGMIDLSDTQLAQELQGIRQKIAAEKEKTDKEIDEINSF